MQLTAPCQAESLGHSVHEVNPGLQQLHFIQYMHGGHGPFLAYLIPLAGEGVITQLAEL